MTSSTISGFTFMLAMSSRVLQKKYNWQRFFDISPPRSLFKDSCSSLMMVMALVMRIPLPAISPARIFSMDSRKCLTAVSYNMAIGGQKVRDKAQFLGILQGYTRGDTLDLLLSRGAEGYQAKLRPQVLDREAGLGLLSWRWGFAPAASKQNPENADGKDAVSGVAVASIRAGGPAAALGLKPGDRILQVGSMRTDGEADLLTAFYRYQMFNQLILSVQRGGQTYMARLRL